MWVREFTAECSDTRCGYARSPRPRTFADRILRSAVVGGTDRSGEAWHNTVQVPWEQQIRFVWLGGRREVGRRWLPGSLARRPHGRHSTMTSTRPRITAAVAAVSGAVVLGWVGVLFDVRRQLRRELRKLNKDKRIGERRLRAENRRQTEILRTSIAEILQAVQNATSSLTDASRAIALIDEEIRSRRDDSAETLRAIEQARSSLAEATAALAERPAERVDAVGKHTLESVRASGQIVRKNYILTRQLSDGFRQRPNEIQAILQLQRRYPTTVPLPIVGGMAMNPSGLVRLLHEVDTTVPSLVVECGSGTSTLWIATALRDRGAGLLVALEHDHRFVEQTRRTLREHHLDDWARVVHAPLVPTPTPRGEFPWYTTDELDDAQTIDLLLVDGPPGNTGPLARYPALPVLGSRLSPQAVVLLDDAQRPDEGTIIEHWIEDDPRLSHRSTGAFGVEVLTRV